MGTTRDTLRFLTGKAFPKLFTPTEQSILIIDASPFGLGAVLERNRKPVIFILKWLSKSEHWYSQTQKEALVMVWAVKRLHQYLFDVKLHIVNNHQALKSIYYPANLLHWPSVATVQRRNVELSAHYFTIEHWVVKSTPHADFLPRYSHFEKPPVESVFIYLNR